MFKQKLSLSHCGILLGALLVASQTQAFTLLRGASGQTTTGWQTNNVTFDLDNSCTPYASLVRGALTVAAETWGNVADSGLKISIGETVTLPNPITTYVGSGASSYAPVGNPIVYCDTAFGANSGSDANTIPGFATSPNMNSSGQIVGTLLVLNFQAGAASNVQTASAEIANVVLTHEIGHCLGFGHSADVNALMYYATGAARKNVLAKDDIDAVAYLYPKQDIPGGLGCATVRSQSLPPSAGLGKFILELLSLAMIAYLLRRTTPAKVRKARIVS